MPQSRSLQAMDSESEPSTRFPTTASVARSTCFAGHETARAVFVGEAKSEWGSLEETLRRQRHQGPTRARACQNSVRVDADARGRSVLIFPEDRHARRVADRFARHARRALSGTRTRDPTLAASAGRGTWRGIWFLSNAGLRRGTISSQIAEPLDSDIAGAGLGCLSRVPETRAGQFCIWQVAPPLEAGDLTGPGHELGVRRATARDGRGGPLTELAAVDWSRG